MEKDFELEDEGILVEKTRGTMKAVTVHQYGGSGTLRLEEVEIPAIRPDEVLIRVHSAGVNPVDWKIREGYMKNEKRKFPFIPGWDVSGTIEETGILVSRYKKGDAVFARPDMSRDGAYAEFVAVPGFELAVVPSRISMQEAAGVPLAAQTAWCGLFEYGHLRRGNTVLIHGASGGVGTFAVQLAKIAGAKVYATTSFGNINLVRALGADKVIDYNAGDFTRNTEKVDMVFDTIGGETQARSFTLLRSGGTLVSIVGVNEEIASKYPVTAKSFMMISNGARLAEIAGLIESGMIRVIIEREFRLEEAREAHELSQTGRAIGKIILRVNQEHF
jgi:NADPH:quinone reductase-like Zn-dependent oxidoreductase